MEPIDAATPAPKLHLYVLLDRSGSMSSMADAVVSGFNELLAEQQAVGPDALLTMVQFDSHDPQEVIADAIPLAEMPPLSARQFVPRGSTPLLDATGLLLGKAIVRANGVGDAEHVVFATITDGHENCSSEFTLDAVRKTIETQTSAGWSFVFLGADPSSYDEAARMGHDVRSTQHFASDAAGMRAAYKELGRATTTRRQKLRSREAYDAADYFEGRKGADEDRKRRGEGS